MTLWFTVTFKQFRFDELLLYPLALYFLWAFVRDFPILFGVLCRSFILFLFPIWWLVTAGWGVETTLIIKSGAQLLLTVMICYCIIARLGAYELMQSLLVASALFGVLSFFAGLGDGLAARGVFSSKNAMGAAMVVLWFSALSVLLTDKFPAWQRLLALAAAVLAVRQIIASDSATAVLLALAATLIIFGTGIMPRTGAFRSPAFYAAILLSACLVFMGASIFLALYEIDPIGSVLEAFGKDTTLTGRTVLWDYARQEIREHPYLGVGAGGFWTPYDPFSTASQIYVEFHKAPYAQFSFHNSYFEIAVHQGLIGLAIAVAVVCWMLWRVTYGVITNNGMKTVFFFCIALLTFARSMSESGLMAPFSLLPMLTMVGALLTLPREPLGAPSPSADSPDQAASPGNGLPAE